jgi:heterodisulfide reductase subunit A
MKKIPTIIVVGAGIGGIKSALSLAELGYRVHLLERRSQSGGTILSLDRQFPSDDCGLCKMLPSIGRYEEMDYCLRRNLRHPMITFHPMSELVTLEGNSGKFTATIRTKAARVDPYLCTGCGKCEDVCPEEGEDPFQRIESWRKAIYRYSPIAYPASYCIDQDLCTRCGKCVEICPVDAIDLDEKDSKEEIEAGAVIAAPGFEEFDASLLVQYGYGRYDNVLTNVELERILSGAGPYQGRFGRPSDRSMPDRIAFIQCVGSRDSERDYCSGACCMYSMKEAILLKEAHPEAEVTVYYMDLRAYGKGYYRYFLKARDCYGIEFVPCRIPGVEEVEESGRLRLVYESQRGDMVEEVYDLVVLAVGQVPGSGYRELGKVLGVDQNTFGFCKTDNLQGNVVSSRPGVYVCGSFASPTDIPRTVTQAEAIVSHIVQSIPPQFSSTPAVHAGSSAAGGVRKKQTDEGTGREEEIERGEIAFFLIDQAGEINGVVEEQAIMEYAAGLSHIASTEVLGRSGKQRNWEEKISDSLSNRPVPFTLFAGVIPNHFENELRRYALQAGLHAENIMFIDLRDSIVNVAESPDDARESIQRAIASSVELLFHPVDGRPSPIKVKKGALVVGGGVAGLTAARSIAGAGYPVDIVERGAEPGGNVRHLRYGLKGEDFQTGLEELIKDVEKSKDITIHTHSRLRSLKGRAGDFTAVMEKEDEEVYEIECGSVIVATGAREHRPSLYGLGENTRVRTQRELEDMIFRDAGELKKAGSIVMIQCAGSRDEDRPYCSKVCCGGALKNALALRGKYPDIGVTVLYRDMMAYELLEQYYTRARDKGVVFLRYDLSRMPELETEGDRLTLKYYDPLLDEELHFEPDYLVLSTGVEANDSNGELAAIMDLPVDDDGFFQELNVKFRPVDFSREGIYLCGLAHSPAPVGEVITQALAAASRAIDVLTRDELIPCRLTAEVSERRCSACEVCIAACPYDARYMDEERHVACVAEALCQACGMCATVCPNNATKIRSVNPNQIFSVIDCCIS